MTEQTTFPLRRCYNTPTIPSDFVMHDIRFIREHKDEFDKGLARLAGWAKKNRR